MISNIGNEMNVNSLHVQLKPDLEASAIKKKIPIKRILSFHFISVVFKSLNYTQIQVLITYKYYSPLSLMAQVQSRLV